MKPTWVKTLIAALWLASLYWLVRYEAFPNRFSNTVQGYRGLLDRDRLIDDLWMRVLYRGQPVGYAYTGVEFVESGQEYEISLNHRLQLRFQVPDGTRDLHLLTEGRLGPDYRLRTFSFDLDFGAHAFKITAARERGDVFRVVFDPPFQEGETRVRIDDNAILFSPFSGLAVDGLSPGQTHVVRVLDPLTLEGRDLRFQAVGRAAVEVSGAPVDTLELQAEYLGMAIRVWMDRQGRVVRQALPFDFVLERCQAVEAFDAVRESGIDGSELVDLALRLLTGTRSP